MPGKRLAPHRVGFSIASVGSFLLRAVIIFEFGFVFLSSTFGVQEEQYGGATLNTRDTDRIVLWIKDPDIDDEKLGELIEEISTSSVQLDKLVEVYVMPACFAPKEANVGFKNVAKELSKLSTRFAKVHVEFHPDVETLKCVSSTIGQWTGTQVLSIYTAPYQAAFRNDELLAADKALAELYRNLPNLHMVTLPEFAGQTTFDALCSTANPRAIFLQKVTAPLKLERIADLSNLSTIFLPPRDDMKDTIAHLMNTKINQVSFTDVGDADIALISQLKQLRALTINSPKASTLERLQGLDGLVRLTVKIPKKNSEEYSKFQEMWDEVASGFSNGLDGGVELWDTLCD